MNMAAIILLVLKTSIVLSVFAIGLKATFADATFLFRRPVQLIRALLSMNVLMPLVALALGAPFDLHPAVKITLVVISVSPIPPILPNKALKAGGKEDYTIGLLVATAVLSIIFIPVTMEVFERITGVSLSMGAGPVAVLVLTTILLPLLVGIAVRSIAHTFAERAAKPVAVIASVLLALSALPVLFGAGRTIFSVIGDGKLLSLAVFALAGFVVGHLLGGPEPDNRPVLALATASRHPAVALAIAHANFPEQKLTAAVVFLYLILSGILSALYLSWVKRRRTADATPEAEKPLGG
jgi:bile acid:Na+ symporter, BASS family